MSPQQDNPRKSMEPLLTLNIGGEIYSTTRRTIEKNDDGLTFLTRLKQYPIDPQGRYFIDRDGKSFRIILNYFRDGTIQLPSTITELKELFLEAKFYQLDRLSNEIENRLNGQNENAQKRTDGLHLTLISDRMINGHLRRIIGPLAIIHLFEIHSIARRFLHLISSHFPLEKISCQFTFPLDDPLIVCQPSDQLHRFVLAKQAKNLGLIVSYCEDFVYLPLEYPRMSYQRLIEHLAQAYHGHRLHQSINNDQATTLIEHWFLPIDKQHTA